MQYKSLAGVPEQVRAALLINYYRSNLTKISLKYPYWCLAKLIKSRFRILLFRILVDSLLVLTVESS